MKIIDYNWRTNWDGKKQGFFTIKDSDYELKDLVLGLKPDNSNDFKSKEKLWYIELGRYGDYRDFSEVIIETLSKLFQKGYVLSEYAKKQYEYWGNRYAELKAKKEEERRLMQEKIEEKKRKEELEKQNAKKYGYVDWCFKYDCAVKNGCGTCNRAFQGCKPQTIKVLMG